MKEELNAIDGAKNAEDGLGKKTELGSVFVSAYPPHSFWRKSQVPAVEEALDTPALPTIGPDGELAPPESFGLYMHIPFCRKRCKFCYYRVYTGKSHSEIQVYLDALAKEISLYSERPALRGRPLKIVYFGGGTPSYPSVRDLRSLFSRIKQAMPWDDVEEVTFECEPGTMTKPKVEFLRESGVTRLSLGVESMNDGVMEENGRAHRSKEVYRVVPWIREQEFDQLNVDLISGMVGETWELWKETVQKTIGLDADSITIYQMELPYNTVYAQDMLDNKMGKFVADWETKREWHQYAFEEFAASGYEISSSNTMAKSDKAYKCLYLDALYGGGDMIGAGLSAFGHISGRQFQNVTPLDLYVGRVNENILPLARAFVATEEESLTREMILLLKLGNLSLARFREKYDVDILEKFGPAYEMLCDQGMLTIGENEVKLTDKGFYRVDLLLQEFFEPKYRNRKDTLELVQV